MAKAQKQSPAGRASTSTNTEAAAKARKPVVGLALGSGAARGWAHIGVIRELEAMGIAPQVISGTSIGALVGAVYAMGELDAFEDWVEGLSSRDVIGLMDFTLSGGFVKGERLFGFFAQNHRNPNIEELEKPFTCIATEMRSGREIWITQGPALDAVRASSALPGVLQPVKRNGRWLLDGGLVNPVPISACRAMNAEVVISVNLNAQLVGVPLSRQFSAGPERGATQEELTLWDRLVGYFSSDDEDERPGLFDVMGASVNIAQDCITRARMAGDPAEVNLVPLLEDFAIMDFHRGKEAIAAGRQVVKQHAGELQRWLGSSKTASATAKADPEKTSDEAAGKDKEAHA